MSKKEFNNQSIRERKDRKENPYARPEKDKPLEDDYSEESDADSVCWDNSFGIILFEGMEKWLRTAFS